MNTTLLTIISTALSLALLIAGYFISKKAERRKLAEQAKKDLENANENNDKSAFLDAFGRL